MTLNRYRRRMSGRLRGTVPSQMKRAINFLDREFKRAARKSEEERHARGE